QNCHVYNIWGKGWTQLIGMGSDIPPETPSNHLCSAKYLHVLEPDLVRTYYSIGFIANSTDCSIEHAIQYVPMTSGSLNGSGAALNLC
ncbi:phage tail protein, partial [Klebsiella pneumoniae]|nr:phage tail protein [Klebsiella pneumoniae]